jgi:hypothetical protein
MRRERGLRTAKGFDAELWVASRYGIGIETP